MTNIKNVRLTVADLLGTTEKGCDTLVIVSDFYHDKGDPYLYGLAFDRSDLRAVEDAFDVYFKLKTSGKWKGINITKRGKLSLRNVGRLVKSGFTLKELEPYRLESENELGHALERFLGIQQDRYNDKVLKRDIAMTANFSGTRYSTRKVQVKLMYTGTTANK